MTFRKSGMEKLPLLKTAAAQRDQEQRELDAHFAREDRELLRSMSAMSAAHAAQAGLTQRSATSMSLMTASNAGWGAPGDDEEHEEDLPARSPRRGSKLLPGFKGHLHAADSPFPPKVSNLPDIANWRTPAPAPRTVQYRMGSTPIMTHQKFQSPFRDARLKQPAPLLTVPRYQRPDLPAPGKPVTLYDRCGNVLPDISGIPAALLQLRADQREEQTRAAEAVSQHDMKAFDRGVGEKLAFARFLTNNKKNKVPLMVMKQFRHQICLESSIVARLRALPLEVIEGAITDIGPRTLNPHQWIAVLHKLIGDDFSHHDAFAVFGFFDTDSDGDIDTREVCNGFCLILSADGPMVSVLHRCHALLRPMLRDTRLTFMTRFELVVMAEAITAASKARLTRRQRKELQAGLRAMLESFGTNKRGEFPYDAVRSAVNASAAIRHAITSFTVPRDERLYQSPISNYFRMGDCDEGELAFRLMAPAPSAAVKEAEVGPHGTPQAGHVAPTRRPTHHIAAPVTLDSDDSDAEPGDPSNDLMVEGGNIFGKKQILPPPPAAAAAAMAASAGNRSQSSEPALNEDLADELPEAALSTESAEAVCDRPVFEPRAPRYFTLRGTLFCGLDGQEPTPYEFPTGSRFVTHK
jgi:hypothetical protein